MARWKVRGRLPISAISPWAITWRCLRDPMFRSFDIIPACDTHIHTHTDRQTHDDGYYPHC